MHLLERDLEVLRLQRPFYMLFVNFLIFFQSIYLLQKYNENSMKI